MENYEVTCDVVRDLMPLVCDGAGSKDSEKIVNTHISVCAECKKIWELLHRRDSALSPSHDDQEEKKGFQKSMRKQKRKFGIWKAVAVFCALIVIGTGILVASNPSIFNELTEKSVPVSLFHDAHLVTTKQGFVFLQFTPDENFPSIVGMSADFLVHWNGEPSHTNRSEYEYRFFYNATNPKRGKDVSFDGLMKKLPGGDAVYMLGFHYMGGKLMTAETVDPEKWRKYEQEVMILMLQSMGAELCCFRECEKTDLCLTDGQERVSLYRAGDTIPLCDDETQAAIDGYFREGKLPNHYLLSCLYAGDENDPAMQSELKAMQDYQISVYSSIAK